MRGRGADIVEPAEYLLRVVRGQARGFVPAGVRSGLWLLSGFYRCAVQARNLLYDVGVAPAKKAPCRVISVGNLTVGGTGKTPMAAWLAKWLRDQGVQAAIVSRGYGRGPTGTQTDEQLATSEALPDVPYLTGKDRYRVVCEAVDRAQVDCIVLDDGFQHRKLRRDLDIVLLDALDPFGLGHVLPRGLLREPVRNLRRADAVVITRSDMCSPALLEDTYRALKAVRADLPIAEAVHAPSHVETLGQDDPSPPEALRGRRVYAFCSIGNPPGFQRTLEELGAVVVGLHAFRDHHWYVAEDLAEVASASREAEAEAVVTTHKDRVKLPADWRPDCPVHVLHIQMEIVKGKSQLEAALRAACGL